MSRRRRSPFRHTRARLIRLRHSRGRLLYALALSALTALMVYGPEDVLYAAAWFVAEGFSAPASYLEPAFNWLALLFVQSVLYTLLWLATTLYAAPLRGLVETLSSVALLCTAGHAYFPGSADQISNCLFVILLGWTAVKLLLIKSGIADRPLPWLSQRRRTRFTLPLTPDEAYDRLRPRIGGRHWDRGWQDLREAEEGCGLLRVDVRRARMAYGLWLHVSGEMPGRRFVLRSALHPADLLADRTGTETIRFTPLGGRATLVEVISDEAHTLHTLMSAPFEDRFADYWAHAAARIAGATDGTFARWHLRPPRARKRAAAPRPAVA